MVTAIRAAINAYKKTIHEHKEKSRLINRDLDYLYLQKLLNSLEENPNKLMISIKLRDGTILELKRQESVRSRQRDPYLEVLS